MKKQYVEPLAENHNRSNPNNPNTKANHMKNKSTVGVFLAAAIMAGCTAPIKDNTEGYQQNNSHDDRLITVASVNSYHSSARGACYTYTSGGKKRYVSRSLCR